MIGDRLISTISQDVAAGTARLRVPVGNDWGSGAYVVATLRRPLDTQAERMPGRAIGVVLGQSQGLHAGRRLQLPPPLRPNARCASRSGSAG